MPNPLIRKLENFTRLSPDDRAAIDSLAVSRVRNVGALEDIIHEGEKPDAVYLILDGWACRYKFLEDGRRQVVAFFLPGDICDPNIFILREMDHSIGTLTSVTVSAISPEAFNQLTFSYPRVTQALLWEGLVTTAIQREWTVNLGQRDSSERVAHLLCELFIRLRSVGLTDGDSCYFPVTQAVLADATGLSTVHMNRTLQELRASGLIVLKEKTLRIPDLKALQREGMFDENYLHLDREGAHLDANE
jgi:CRP-like cAMP-binding protein